MPRLQEEERVAKEKADKEAEEARELMLKEAYEAAIPDEIHLQVEVAVKNGVASLHQTLEADFAERNADLLKKIEELQTKVVS